MVVVVIVAIFAAVAIPSYQEYVRRAQATQAQQEIMRLSTLLERHKARNFSYRGFEIPIGTTDSSIKYDITIVDGEGENQLLTANTAVGRTWAIRALSTDARNFSMLLTSTGLRCKNKAAANIVYTGCGIGTEEW